MEWKNFFKIFHGVENSVPLAAKRAEGAGAAAAAAGAGWAQLSVAATPDDNAVIAAGLALAG